MAIIYYARERKKQRNVKAMSSKKYICIVLAIILLIIYFYPSEKGQAAYPPEQEIILQTEIDSENLRHKKTSEEISLKYDSKIKEIRGEIVRIKEKYKLSCEGAAEYSRRLKATDCALAALQTELISLESESAPDTHKAIKIRKSLSALSDKREKLFNLQCAAGTVEQKEKLIAYLQAAKEREKREENRWHAENLQNLSKEE